MATLRTDGQGESQVEGIVFAIPPADSAPKDFRTMLKVILRHQSRAQRNPRDTEVHSATRVSPTHSSAFLKNIPGEHMCN